MDELLLMSATKKKAATKKVEKVKTPEITREFLENAYWEYVLEHGKKPASVYKLSKEIKINEKDFYGCFSSFQALVEYSWQQLVLETQQILDADADYQAYDSRGKLLAFFYTFFEKALGHRSRFLSAFPRREKALFCPSLRGMKEAFDASAKDLMAHVISEGGSPIPAKITEESYRGGWPVFLFLIDFWLNDTSENFQDTDSLIEKTVRFGHEVTHFSAVEAAFDLGKFLFGRKMV